MLNQFSRTELLIGKDGINKLSKSKVIIFGIGGVGSYATEALARTGIYEFDLVDNDRVSLTNINRQIIATTKTIGEYKVEVMKQRILEINPAAKVNMHKCFFLPNSQQFEFQNYSYIIDAIDTITSKIELVVQANDYNIPIISSMGAGNKLDPTKFQISDIYKTSVCPVAKVMRYELKKRNIKHLKVVYSTEQPIKPKQAAEEIINKKVIPGSISFVPSAAGLIIASEVIKDLIGG